MSDLHDDLEHGLRAGRPQPRGEFLDALVTRVGRPAAPARRGAWQGRLALVLALAALVSLAALGGVSVAKSGSGKAAEAASRVTQPSTVPHVDEDEDEAEEESGDRRGRVVVCLTRKQRTKLVKPKRAQRLVARGRATYGPCPVP